MLFRSLPMTYLTGPLAYGVGRGLYDARLTYGPYPPPDGGMYPMWDEMALPWYVFDDESQALDQAETILQEHPGR